MGACSILKAVLGPEKLSSLPTSGPLSAEIVDRGGFQAYLFRLDRQIRRPM